MLNDDDCRAIIKPMLIGDRLLWVGRPDPRVTFVMWPSISMFLFGVFWTTWCVVLPYAFHDQTGIRDPSHIAVSLIGLWFLLSPIWYYYDAKRTVYGITDKRLLIVVNREMRESFDASAIGGIKVKERSWGSGDVRFAWRPDPDDCYQERWHGVWLVGIRDVRSVEKLLRNTFDNEPGRP